jgi:hypothetical protein
MVCPRCHEEKGTLAAIGALALLTMIHKDVGDVLNEAVFRLRVDPDQSGTQTRDRSAYWSKRY